MTDKIAKSGAGSLGPTPTYTSAQQGAAGLDPNRITYLQNKVKESTALITKYIARIHDYTKALAKNPETLNTFEVQLKHLNEAITELDSEYNCLIKLCLELQDSNKVLQFEQEKERVVSLAWFTFTICFPQKCWIALWKR